jgi:hypothetical protein
MAYYWDSSHYKQIVGDWILDRVLGFTRPDRPPPPGFGVTLTPETIDSALAETRRARETYRHDNATDVAFIAEVVTQVREEKNGPVRSTRSSGG